MISRLALTPARDTKDGWCLASRSSCCVQSTLWLIIVVPSAGIDRQLHGLYPILQILYAAMTSPNASKYIEPPFFAFADRSILPADLMAGGQECGCTKSG